VSPIRWLKSITTPLVRTGAEWLARNGFYRLAERWGYGARSYSGESVTNQGALTHSVVWACVRIISESVAFLPLSLMRDKDGEKNPAKEHPTYLALHNAPNAEMTTMTMRETMTAHMVMGGMCYAQIMRRSGTGEAMEFWPLAPEQVTPDREKKGSKRLIYVVKEGNSPDKTYTVERGKAQDLLVIPGLGYDGIRGYSVVSMASNSIGNAQAVEKYAGRFFAAGGRQSGFIEMAQKFKTTEDMKKFREDLNKFVQNPETSHQWPVFEPGQKFIPGGFSPEQSQFLETRQWTPAEICRWFLISPHMVGDLTHATFSNIEHLALEFVKKTLTAWIKRWEENLWRCVLTPEEKEQGYYFWHNVNGLLRGDFQTRMAGYSTALQNGFMNQNEVRDLEDMNGFEGGDDYHIQLNLQTLPGGTPTTGEQVALAKIGTAKKGAYIQ